MSIGEVFVSFVSGGQAYTNGILRKVGSAFDEDYLTSGEETIRNDEYILKASDITLGSSSTNQSVMFPVQEDDIKYGNTSAWAENANWVSVSGFTAGNSNLVGSDGYFYKVYMGGDGLKYGLTLPPNTYANVEAAQAAFLEYTKQLYFQDLKIETLKKQVENAFDLLERAFEKLDDALMGGEYLKPKRRLEELLFGPEGECPDDEIYNARSDAWEAEYHAMQDSKHESTDCPNGEELFPIGLKRWSEDQKVEHLREIFKRYPAFRDEVAKTLKGRETDN
jgi:hypothetical protein